MRLEFETNTSALPFVEEEVVKESASSEAAYMLRQGIKAAREGSRAEAKTALLRATELEPANENAWLWLASISEYPEELLVFLNNVLNINPENERALEWHQATKSLLAKTLVQRGIEASKENKPDFARQYFEQALEHDAQNEMAWLWMASMAGSDEEKAGYFEKVMELNPGNETARVSLETFHRNQTQMRFQEAVEAAVSGRREAAREMLENFLNENSGHEEAWVLKSHLANSFAERAAATEKVLELNPENEMAQAWMASWQNFVEQAAPPADRVEESASPAEMVEEFDQSAEVAPDAPTPAVLAVEMPAEEAFEEFPAIVESAPESEQENVQESEPISFFAEQMYYHNDSVQPDGPTQDLSLMPDFPVENQEEAVSEMPESFESEAQSAENEESYNWEPRFDSTAPVEENPVAQTEPVEEVETEENQMSWAFAEETEPAQEFEFNQESDNNSMMFSDEFQTADEENSLFEETPAQMNFEVAAEEMNFEVAEEEETESEFFAEPAAAVWFENETENYHHEFSTQELTPNVPAAPDFEDEPVMQVADEAPVAEHHHFEENPVEDAPEAAFAVEPTPEGSADIYEIEADEDFSLETEAANPDYVVTDNQEVFQEAEDHSPAEEVPMPVEARLPVEAPVQQKFETLICPFCSSENEQKAFACGSCQTILTLSDLEMLLGQQNANREVLKKAVASFEEENISFGLKAEQMSALGVGHINLKNFREGFFYLQEAVRLNPSNVVFGAQVNALAIRLAEIEEQKSVYDAMPKNRKILVVDDSPTVRKLISGKLEKCGHEVVCAVDGLDALEKISEMTPDLILLDITMPRMDGYQVCKMIRGNDATKDVPVVMISGKDGFFDKVRGRMAGSTGYITKPFGPETLMKTVETYIN